MLEKDDPTQFDWVSVRGISPKEIGNRGFFPSDKVSTGVVAYESQIERDLYLILDHDPDVIIFQHQPCYFQWKDENGKKRQYCPDTKVQFKGLKPFIIEVKDDITYEANKEKMSTKLKWTEAKLKSDEIGCIFSVLTDKNIRTPRLANIWFCLGSSKINPEPYHISELMKQLTNSGIEYNELCFKLAENIGVEFGKAAQIVCYGIYHGLIWVPSFSSSIICSNTLLYKRTSKKHPFSPLTIELGLISNNREKSHPLKVKEYQEEEIKYQNTPPPLLIPEKYKSHVLQREKVILKWLRKPKHLRSSSWRIGFVKESRKFLNNPKLHETTIYRWLKAYQKEGVLGLIPKTTKRGRKSSIDPKVIEIMEDFRQKYIASRMTTTLKSVYSHAKEGLVQHCKKLSLEPPSFVNFIRFIYNKSTASEFAQGRGSKYYQTHFSSNMGSFKGATQPMQVLQIDSSSFDCFPVDSKEFLSLGTPNLVSAIDLYSKMITGYYLSLAPINRVSILETLVQSILSKSSLTEKYETLNDWNIEGFPVLILVDNEMTYRAKAVKDFCMKYNIILEFAPIRKPQYKAFIERWFGLLRQGLEYDKVPGRRPLKKYRIENPNLKPEAEAILTMQEIEEWLGKWIIDNYHQKNQYNDHVPAPSIKYNDAYKETESLILPYPRKPHESMIKRIYLDTLEREKRKLTNDGILRKYILYNSQELKELYETEGEHEVSILIDPRDISTCIWVENPYTGKTIEVFPKQGWAASILQYFGRKGISDKTWDQTRKFIRGYYRGRINPDVLNIGDTIRQEHLSNATKLNKQKKRKRIKEEIKKENERKSIHGRAIHTETIQNAENGQGSNMRRKEKKKYPPLMDEELYPIKLDRG